MRFQRVEPASAPISAAMAFAMAAATLIGGAMVFASTDVEAQARANVQAGQNRSIPRPSRTLPATGRYLSESGESFVFDRSDERPLFRFESRNEVWALRPTAAPRGDIIYRNEGGVQILRVTPDGGMTLYSVRAPNGSPASMTGLAPSLPQPMLGPVELARLMLQRGALLSRTLGRAIVVALDGEDDEALCIDALMVSTDAVLRLAASPTTRPQLDRLHTVTITEGRSASVIYVNGDLRVTVQPNQGVTGRPSSARVIRAVLHN